MSTESRKIPKKRIHCSRCKAKLDRDGHICLKCHAAGSILSRKRSAELAQARHSSFKIVDGVKTRYIGTVPQPEDLGMGAMREWPGIRQKSNHPDPSDPGCSQYLSAYWEDTIRAIEDTDYRRDYRL